MHLFRNSFGLIDLCRLSQDTRLTSDSCSSGWCFAIGFLHRGRYLPRLAELLVLPLFGRTADFHRIDTRALLGAQRKGSVWSNAPVRSVKSERGHALSGAPEVRTGWSSRRSSIPSQAAAATGESCRLRAVGQSRTADGPAASGRGAPLHIPRCKRRCRLRLKPPDPASFA